MAAEGYTIDEVDEAIRVICGAHAVRRGDSSWARPHAMQDAAVRAWISRRPEDHHSLALRAALTDLNKSGYLKPRDGVWPE